MWISKKDLLKAIEVQIPDDGCDMRISVDHDTRVLYDADSRFPSDVLRKDYLEIVLRFETDKFKPRSKLVCESCGEARDDIILFRDGYFCPDCSFEGRG